jgi:hypothetical protein
VTARPGRWLLLARALALAGACGGDAPPGRPDGPEAASVTAARARFPRAIDVHTGVIARSCSPNPGVCHNASGYPDLTSFGALASAIDAPCNVELPDRSWGWNGCERRPWAARAGGFGSDIAWIEQRSSGRWRLGLRDRAPATREAPAELIDADGDVVLPAIPEWQFSLATAAGSREAELAAGGDDAGRKQQLDALAASAVGGDPNEDGRWGGDGALIRPGSLERSYLWGRITGAAPGSRMPLANQPLSADEYVAIACWIEALARLPFPRAADPIDYDACRFAWDPIDHAQ